MFSGITNLIFGSSSSTEIAESRAESPSRLKTVTTDDEWEFVDRSSRGNSPARQVKTNPMENLLIEHPSMSVYDTRGRPSSTGHESDGHESSSDTEMAETSTTNAGRSRAVTAHSSGRSRVVTAKQQLLAQQRVRKSMQLQQKKKDHKKLANSHLQRSNKVAHVQSARPMRRQHFMQLRNSGAVNDRKSQ